ncbi:hypothetical protein AC249_AIPGENE27265, partial [Exaiptasia diaphana]
GSGRRRFFETLLPRAPNLGAARAPTHCTHLRRWRRSRHPALLCHGIRGRHPVGRSMCRAEPGEAIEAVPRGLRRGALRPSEPDRAPGPQTQQHSGDSRWAAQAAGFRNRRSLEPQLERAEAAFEPWAADHRLCQPGAAERRESHHRHRHLLAWSVALQDPERLPPLSPSRHHQDRADA